jgi:hypothetical protein
MHGYRVTLQNHEVVVIEATSYIVGDDGALEVVGGDERLDRWRPGEWLMIDELGTRLTDQWPSQLDALINEAATVLAVRDGHYVHGLRDTSAFDDWRCSELESLTQAILGRLGLTGDTSQEHTTVRELISRHFHVSSQ